MSAVGHRLEGTSVEGTPADPHRQPLRERVVVRWDRVALVGAPLLVLLLLRRRSARR